MEQLKGLWWTPEEPNSPIAGVLQYDQDKRVTLELDCLSSRKPSNSLERVVWNWSDDDDKELLTVHGKTHNGKVYTLWGGFVRRFSTGSSGFWHARIDFNRGIEGWAFEEPSSIPVEKIYSRFFGLASWIDHNPFQIKYANRYRNTTVTHRLPAIIRTRVDQNRILTLSWNRVGPTKSIVQTHLSVESTPAVGIEYSKPQPLDTALDDIGVAGNLLSLFLGAPTTSHKTEFFSPHANETVGKKTSPKKLKPLGAKFPLKDTLADWTPDDVLLPLPTIQNLLDQIVPRWFAMHNEFGSTLTPYFASLRTPAPFANDRFFTLASVAESLHRCLAKSSKPISRADWKKIKEAILAEVPAKRLPFVKSRLSFMNELSYFERLMELIKRFPSLMSEVVGDGMQLERFCQRVTKLRNMEAHKGSRSADRVDGSTLVRLTSKLRVIIDVWLLVECGIPLETIKNAVRENHRYWFYASNQTWPWSR